ncbi:MAG TPA: hypothetical protein VNU20_03550 [Candidatus Sulfotelmatobacter sp.]|nr:hypothetical protein [Candidatus Sulfotelmatobacter sp.]
MNWLYQNYKWMFDGIGGVALIALIGFLYRLWFKPSSRSSTQTIGQESRSPLILDPFERPLPREAKKSVWAKRWAMALLVLAVLGICGRMYYRTTRISVLSPPTRFRVVVSSEIPVVLEHGKLLQLKPEQLPCSNGKSTAHGLEGLHDLPGGADFKKPYFLLRAKKFIYEETPDGKSVEFFVEAELTNRGESSVAKDWSVCFSTEGNKAVHFDAEHFQIADRPEIGAMAISLVDATSTMPLEHGHALNGWLLFRFPKDEAILKRFTGSVQCRDYLDRPAVSLFKPQHPNSTSHD